MRKAGLTRDVWCDPILSNLKLGRKPEKVKTEKLLSSRKEVDKDVTRLWDELFQVFQVEEVRSKVLYS